MGQLRDGIVGQAMTHRYTAVHASYMHKVSNTYVLSQTSWGSTSQQWHVAHCWAGSR